MSAFNLKYEFIEKAGNYYAFMFILYFKLIVYV